MRHALLFSEHDDLVKANKMDTSWCLRLERLQDWCIRPYYPSYSHSGIALSSATGMTRSQGGMAILTSGGALSGVNYSFPSTTIRIPDGYN